MTVLMKMHAFYRFLVISDHFVSILYFIQLLRSFKEKQDHKYEICSQATLHNMNNKILQIQGS